MTILLADDEFHVRKKLLNKIDWSSLGIHQILEAENGEQGYEKALKTKIDIVISDIRMPIMDGVEMCKKIRLLYPECVILFLSGYSDQEYLRSAIFLHALQYIDKPISLQQVTSAISEAVIYSNNLNGSTAFALKVKEARLVQLLCTPSPDNNQLSSLLSTCGISPFNFSDSRTILLRLFTNDTIPSAILDKIKQVISDSGISFIIGNHGDTHIVIHLLSDRENLISNYSPSFIQTLLKRISYQLDNFNWFMSVGCISRNINEIYHSYQSAVISLQSNFFLGINSISYAGDTSDTEYRPNENIRRILQDSVRQNQPQVCSDALQNLYNEYKNHPTILSSMVREFYYSILSQLFNYCITHHIHFQISNNQQLWDWVASALTLDDLHDITKKIYNSYFIFLTESHNEASVSENIKKVISENYANPDLGLQFLSDNLNLSQSYISRLFKQETGSTINQYIITYRIDTASSLLLNTSYKISDISRCCGFTDQNYFTKLFKKCTGTTPSDYRGTQL